MTVLSYLQRYLTENPFYTDTDPRWRQFISDYILILKEKSTVYNVTAQMAEIYYQDIPGLLRHIGSNTDPRADWIVRLVNDLKSDLEFTGAITLYVPSTTVVANLYDVWRTPLQNEV